MSYNAVNTSVFPMARGRPTSRVDAGSNNNTSAVSPNYPANNKKAPIMRERNVAMSVGQQPPASESTLRRNSASAAYSTPTGSARRSSVANNNNLNRPNSAGSVGYSYAAPPSVGRPSSARSGQSPNRHRSSSNAPSGGSAGGYCNLDYGGDNVYAAPFASQARSRGRRPSVARNSEYRSRARAESPKPEFSLDTTPANTPSKKHQKKKTVDAKEVERQWRESLRRGNAAGEHDEYSDNESGAPVVAAGAGARDASASGGHADLVLMQQQMRRGSTEHGPTKLEKEIPYDYIRVAKNERAQSPHPVAAPPAVYAVKKKKVAKKNAESKRKSETLAQDREGFVMEEVKPKQQQQQQQQQNRFPAFQRQPEQIQKEDSVYANTYQYEIPKEASEVDENENSRSQICQATAETRASAYQQWRERTANGLYRDVFAAPADCERVEVPPFFEPVLDATEATLAAKAAGGQAALDDLKEQVLRYRLATQRNTKKTSIEDIRLSAADANKFVPMVRAVRYAHEEQNWQNALATIRRNQERVAEKKVQCKAAAVAHQRAISGGEDDEGLAAWNKESSPHSTSLRSPHRSGQSGGGMSSVAINSATTPGWLRHREFSASEWDELRGKRDVAANSKPNSRSASLGQSARVDGAVTGSSPTGARGPPRNPMIPAWMHRLNQAQAEEEANDPQHHKLDEIDTASSVGRQRQAIGYSIGQSNRVGNRSPGGDGNEDSLSFLDGGSMQSGQYSLARPTRVDVSAARPDVVENSYNNDSPADRGLSTSEGVSRAVTMALAKVAEEAPQETPQEEALPVAPVAPVAPVTPVARPVQVLEKVTFTLFSFSTFEATQEMKRVVWWCAGHGIDAFTVRSGHMENYHNPADPQARSFSPTFFPGTSRFHDEVLVTVQRDMWLRKRVTVAAHDAHTGDIDIELTLATMVEAAQQNWLQRAVAEDEEHESAAARQNRDILSTAAQPPTNLAGTQRPTNGTTNSTQPPLVLSTARGDQPVIDGAAAVPREPLTNEYRFFTENPHPNGSPLCFEQA